MAVIDVRGTNDELFRSLGQIVRGLTRNEDDEMRKLLFDNPQFRTQLTDEAHRFLQGAEGATNILEAIELRGGDQEAIPGLGRVSPEILQELIDTTPESRDSQVRSIFNRMVAPGEVAGVQATELQTRGKVAAETGAVAVSTGARRAAGPGPQALGAADIVALASDVDVAIEAGEAARFSTGVRKAAIELGMDAQAVASVELLEMQTKNAQLKLTQEGLESYKRIYDAATGIERNIITANLSESQGQLYGQFLLQELAYDNATTLASLRNSIGSAGDDLELQQAVLKYKIDAWKARDTAIEKLRLAIDEKNRDEILFRIEDINNIARGLMQVDPEAGVAVATETRGLLKGVKGVEFSVRDITDFDEELGARFEVEAQKLADAGVTPEAIELLEARLTDPETGKFNRTFLLAAQERAYELAGNEGVTDRETVRAAAQSRAELLDHTGKLREARDTEIEELQALTTAILGEGKPRQMGEGSPQEQFSRLAPALVRLKFLQFVRFLSGPTERELVGERGERPSAVKAAEARIRGGN